MNEPHTNKRETENDQWDIGMQSRLMSLEELNLKVSGIICK